MIAALTALMVISAPQTAGAGQATYNLLLGKDPALCSQPAVVREAEASIRRRIQEYYGPDPASQVQITFSTPRPEGAHPDRTIIYCSTNVTIEPGTGPQTSRVILEVFQTEPNVRNLRSSVHPRFAVGVRSSDHASDLRWLEPVAEEFWKARPAPFQPPR